MTHPQEPVEVTQADEHRPITQREMVEMFGEEMPIEAINLLWGADGNVTCGQLRAELRRMAGSRLATEQSREADHVPVAFQQRVAKWMGQCFPPSVVADRLERRDRLVEEALELAQTLPAFTADRAHALVDYVFSRPVGATEQEVGGVSVTLAALCHAEGIEQAHWAEVELARIRQPEVMDKIRAKQAAKPTGSALPSASPSTPLDRNAVLEEAAKVAEHYDFGPERDERDNARNSICRIIAANIRALRTEPAAQVEGEG